MVLERAEEISLSSQQASEKTSHLSTEDDLLNAEDQILAAVDMGTPKQHQLEQWQRITGFGIGVGSLFAKTLVSHPCVVFRRQCQINYCCVRYHLTPFSVFQVMLSLQRNQGFTTLWKGLTSTLGVQGLSLCTESVIAEVTSFPKEIHSESNIKQLCSHLTLKALSALVTLPFYSASLIETVQSDIASETGGVVEFVKEGFGRLLGWGMPRMAHLLPVWSLAPPVVLHGLARYLLVSCLQFAVLRLIRRHPPEEAQADPAHSSFLPELTATYAAHLSADLALYPAETVLHRLLVQGTRTIIDDTDLGTDVLPINTQYQGFFHCYAAVVQEEGVAGLYKGLGALLLQYTLQLAVLRLTRAVFLLLSREFERRKQGPL